MTARQGKIVSMALIMVLAVAIAFDVAMTLIRRRPLGGLATLLPGVLLIVLFVNLWGRYAQIEAEHGPDYAATKTSGRSLLVLLVLVLAIGGELTAYLLTHR